MTKQEFRLLVEVARHVRPTAGRIDPEHLAEEIEEHYGKQFTVPELCELLCYLAMALAGNWIERYLVEVWEWFKSRGVQVEYTEDCSI